ncbi:hypothetical protein QAD02_007066, partial [Eretmocerus hayati]
PANVWTTLGGDCPLLRDLLAEKRGPAWQLCKFLVSYLRGFSQCGFANNPISGLIFMISLAVVSPARFLVCSLAGLLGHLVSMLIQEPSVNIDNGLTVFNPLIFGAVSHYFVPVYYGDFDGFSVSMMLLCVIFMSYFWRAFGKGGLPCLTIPFNLAELLLLFTLKNARDQIQSNSTLQESRVLSLDNATAVSAADLAHFAAENATLGVGSLDWGIIARASVASASQLFVVDSVPLGAIVYLGVLIYSPITCLFGFLGALGGSLVGLQVGAPHDLISIGLWGYNGYLVGASVGGCFFILNAQVAAAACVAIVLSTFLQHVLQIIFASSGMPVGTIPFVLTVWLFIGLGKAPEGAFFYPLTMSCPEEQRREYYSRRRIAKLEQMCEAGEPEVLLQNGKATSS